MEHTENRKYLENYFTLCEAITAICFQVLPTLIAYQTLLIDFNMAHEANKLKKCFENTDINFKLYVTIKRLKLFLA